jgi:hypothetical protein
MTKQKLDLLHTPDLVEFFLNNAIRLIKINFLEVEYQLSVERNTLLLIMNTCLFLHVNYIQVKIKIIKFRWQKFVQPRIVKKLYSLS